MTQLHYLFTDGCSGVAHCHACYAHYAKDVFPNIRRTQDPEDRAHEDRFRNMPYFVVFLIPGDLDL